MEMSFNYFQNISSLDISFAMAISNLYEKYILDRNLFSDNYWQVSLESRQLFRRRYRFYEGSLILKLTVATAPN